MKKFYCQALLLTTLFAAGTSFSADEATGKISNNDGAYYLLSIHKC